MADKKNKGLQGDLLTCPRCKGRGKIVCQRDEEDLYGHEQTCPVCGGPPVAVFIYPLPAEIRRGRTPTSAAFPAVAAGHANGTLAAG